MAFSPPREPSGIPDTCLAGGLALVSFLSPILGGSVLCLLTWSVTLNYTAFAPHSLSCQGHQPPRTLHREGICSSSMAVVEVLAMMIDGGGQL